jgi:hypothetical protein
VLKICRRLRDTVEVARLRKLLERHYLQELGVMRKVAGSQDS